MLTGMDDITPDRYQGVETEAEKQRRLAWEAERIAEARADVIAGRLVDSAKVKAWIDSIGTDHELPVPYSGR
jgi:predicted transcriptional regulator